MGTPYGTGDQGRTYGLLHEPADACVPHPPSLLYTCGEQIIRIALGNNREASPQACALPEAREA